MEFQNIWCEKSRVLPRPARCHPECNEGSQGLHYCPPPRRPRDSSLRSEWQRIVSSCSRLYVILSVTKDLLAGYALSTRVVAGRLRGDSSLRSEWQRIAFRMTLYSVIARLGTSRGNLTLLITNYSLLIIWDSHGRYAPSEWRNLCSTLSHLSLYPHPLWHRDIVTRVTTQQHNIREHHDPIIIKKSCQNTWQKVFNGCIFAAGIREENLRRLGRLKKLRSLREVKEIKEIKDYPP